MVIKIKPPAPSAGSAVRYNERKVAEGNAKVVFSSAIANPRKPMETFDIYERGSLRTQKMSFHASINPSKTDDMDEAKVVAFTKEFMERMGYGDQPYILYKHNDIDREHYHLVSVRVDANGRKINNRQEGRKCQKVMKELSEKYGFTIGLDKSNNLPEDPPNSPAKVANPANEAAKTAKQEKLSYQVFDPEKGETMKQIEALVAQAMKYHFTTDQQFIQLMKSFGVKVCVEKNGGKLYYTFAGLDRKNRNKPCTAPVIAKDLHVPSLSEINAHMERCKTEVRTREKNRAANLARIALDKGTSELHIRRILKKYNISIVLSRTRERYIFGATLIDHQTRCVFKASELKGLSASEFERARTEKWPPEEAGPVSQQDRQGEYNEDAEKGKASPSEAAAEEAAEFVISAIGSERSRRSEDEEAMRKGKRR